MSMKITKTEVASTRMVGVIVEDLDRRTGISFPVPYDMIDDHLPLHGGDRERALDSLIESRVAMAEALGDFSQDGGGQG